MDKKGAKTERGYPGPTRGVMVKVIVRNETLIHASKEVENQGITSYCTVSNASSALSAS